MLYKPSDQKRLFKENCYPTPYRSEWNRDHSRLVHSPSFRRLQGKTQLYPGIESDFFRNRLTHSLEVAAIAKSIAQFLNSKYDNLEINEEICEFAGLAHDLGHPPFGHQGEAALDECMLLYGGFEGNAQTLRILSIIEKRECLLGPKKDTEFRYGLNLTARTLAAILKYDNPIPDSRKPGGKSKPIKGYYQSEEHLVKFIKDNVVGSKYTNVFKTIECQIMDIADDIAYSTYDLEDGMKAGFFHPMDFFGFPIQVYEKVAKKVGQAIGRPDFSNSDIISTLQDIFVEPLTGEFNIEVSPEQLQNVENVNDLAFKLLPLYNRSSKNIANNAYARNIFTSELIYKAIESVEVDINTKFPSMSKVSLREDRKIQVEVLKNITYESQILSPRLKVAEYRGKEIVREIFKSLNEDEGYRLMPEDYQKLYHHFTSEEKKMRVICDFIAGMTDRYAIEFYGRLKSENPETIFKPF